jgi:hypothetical protein
MSPSETLRHEVLAALRVLVHMVRADGRVTRGERDVLRPFVEALALDDAAFERLLAEEGSLLAQLLSIRDARIRDVVLEALPGVAGVDGLAPEQTELMDKIRRHWGRRSERVDGFGIFASRFPFRRGAAQVDRAAGGDVDGRATERAFEELGRAALSYDVEDESLDSLDQLARRLMVGDLSSREAATALRRRLVEP